ncbi:hypothetical protein LCGC14_2130910 [marine sediment metagenome]|uniref:Uncharacterized protein n=1 Tax=marine sediment metagenome TaxID=412755 RepID=A0A0F9E1E6_9ZZZZ
MFKGKKTYIVAVLIGIATTVRQLGFIDDEFFKAILVFLGAGGLAALRAGISKR